MINKKIINILVFFIILIFIALFIILFKKNNNLIIKDYKKPKNYKQLIEKNIFQIYGSKKLPKKFKKIVNHLRNQNPEYKYHLFDDYDMENFIKNNYPEYWESYYLISQKYIVAKGDFFRYLIVYHYGGVYFDIKSGCKVPLRKIIKPDDEMILTDWNISGINIDEYIQWCIICKKKHPILKIILDTINSKIKNYNFVRDGYGHFGVLRLTGPRIFSKILNKNKNKYNITKYNNLINHNLVYSYLDKNNFDFFNCGIKTVTKNSLGYCNHSSSKKRYSILNSPIIDKSKEEIPGIKNNNYYSECLI